MVAPGLFLVLMYVVIVLLGNQMLTSTTEEKENRVVELLLTSVPAKTLMSAKIWALVSMGLIQIAAILLPMIVAYVGWRDLLKLPDFDVSSISLAPGPIVVGAVLLAGGFLMFTGLLVTIGAAVPTAKEASGYFGARLSLCFCRFMH
ncbi:ABC transporter permease [bacterium]|nr:MAG: ABC transporter permease [bacterium]